jgi:hypothetical protein
MSDQPAEVEVEAVDIGEMVNRERVHSIFEARTECRQYRTKAKAQDGDDYTPLYRSALESFIREVEPLLKQTEDGQELWSERAFGAAPIAPEHKKPRDTTQPRQINLVGLKSLFELECPAMFEIEIVEKSPRRKAGEKVKPVTVSWDVPFWALDEMFAAVNTHLSDLGFGIALDEAGKQTKLDDDLIAEVEKWRRENL